MTTAARDWASLRERQTGPASMPQRTQREAAAVRNATGVRGFIETRWPTRPWRVGLSMSQPRRTVTAEAATSAQVRRARKRDTATMRGSAARESILGL